MGAESADRRRKGALWKRTAHLYGACSKTAPRADGRWTSRPGSGHPNERKWKLATEILNEIQAFGGSSGTKAIYIRDFNIDDPEIKVYIVNTSAEPEILGCTFNAAKSPHCQWHGFGQAPVSFLKREIVRRAYKLCPPPIGKAYPPPSRNP